MAEVFISYSREDRDSVAPIAAHLKELNIDVWFDPQLVAGDDFSDVILKKLQEAKAVLVCWSPTSAVSPWVRGEAQYARKQRSYLPVFIEACELLPPYNELHTDDLSKWSAAPNDSNWLKVVDQIAQLIGRNGVGVAARAFAAGDQQLLLDFARRFPEEPAAARIWREAEARYRAEFAGRLDEARAAAAGRTAWIAAEVADLEKQIEAAVQAFEAWLVDERRGTVNGLRPDPTSLVKRHMPSEERKLRDEFSGLQTAFTQSKEELEAARAEVTHLTGELTAKAEALERCRTDNANLSVDTSRAASLSKGLDAAKTEVVQLSEKLVGAERDLKKLASVSEEFQSCKAQLRTATERASDSAQKLAIAREELGRLGAENAGLYEDAKKLVRATDLIEKLSKLKGADKIIGAPLTATGPLARLGRP